MTIRLVAFDLVGTLVKGEIFTDAREQISIDFNNGWTKAERATRFDSRFDYEAVFRFFIDQNSAQFLYRRFQEFLVTNMTTYIFDDVNSRLKELSARNITLGFVTDGAEEIEGQMIGTLLDHLGIAKEKCIVITGDQIGANKATGLPFRELRKRAAVFGIDSSEIIFVGDRQEKDIDPAIKEGLRAELIDRGEEPVPKAITSLGQVLTLLTDTVV